MILDHIDALRRCCVDSRLIAGLDYLKQMDLTLPAGRYEIGDHGMHVMVNEYETAPREERQFEAHRRHIDIQMMMSGEEAIDWCPLAQLPKVHTPFSLERDYGLYLPDEKAGGAATIQPLLLREGMVAIFYPQDGHRPGLTPEGVGVKTIRKAVLKVPV